MGEDSVERDVSLLLDMKLAAEDALSFVADIDKTAFTRSRLHQNAVIRSLEVIGEAAGKISAKFVVRHPQVPWREVTSLRHRLIHGYAEVRLDIVWDVTQDRLPALLKILGPLIPPENDKI